MFAFLQLHLGKFVKIHAIQNTVMLNEIDLLNPVNQLPEENLFFVFTTKSWIMMEIYVEHKDKFSTKQCMLFML